MKKLMIALAVAAMAVAAQAALVNGDFSSSITGGKNSLDNIAVLGAGWYTNNSTAASWGIVGGVLTRTLNQTAYSGAGQFFTYAGSGAGHSVSWDATITDSDGDLDYWVQLYGYNQLGVPSTIGAADALALTGSPAVSNTPAGLNYGITLLGSYYHVNLGSASGNSFNFTADSGYEFYGIRIIANRPDAIDSFTIDNVTVVPEPATVGMLGLGALVTLLVRRMKR